MTMNSSGPISLAGTTAGVSIEIENGGNGTTQISLNDSAVRSLAGVPGCGTTITMPTNFYGKSNQFSFTISSNQTNYCLRAAAVSAGWNQSSKLVATINSGVVLSANGTGSFGLTISGSYPGGVQLNNRGYIVGMGGNGGKGQSGFVNNPSAPGSAGGTGLKISSPVSICNSGGVIAGGGGGGGGANRYYCCGSGVGGGGGGGGRSSNYPSSGGSCGCCGGGYGNPGTFSSAGTSNNTGNPGGTGGNWGASGGSGASGGKGGGGGGKATCGASVVTWLNNGTRYGSIG